MQVNYTTILSMLEPFLLHYCVNLSTTLLLLHRKQYKEVVSTRFALSLAGEREDWTKWVNQI